LFLGLKVLRQWGFERQLVRAALGDQFFAWSICLSRMTLRLPSPRWRSRF
jgi:hypothetical protein